MAFLVSPGVQVNEIDLTSAIRAGSFSRAGFVGGYSWGPVEEVTTIASERELLDNFGKPKFDGAVDFTTAAMFLKYANTLQNVRVVDETVARNATSDEYNSSALIKNSTHYDALTDSLQATATVSLTVLANGLAEATTLRVSAAEASLITGGDFISGTGIPANTTISSIAAINDGSGDYQLTLSQPLEGQIPVVEFVNETVEFSTERTIEQAFAAGSNQISVSGIGYNYMNGARISGTSFVSGSATVASATVVASRPGPTDTVLTLSNALAANVPFTATIIVEQDALFGYDPANVPADLAVDPVVQIGDMGFFLQHSEANEVNYIDFIRTGDEIVVEGFPEGTKVLSVDPATMFVSVDLGATDNILYHDAFVFKRVEALAQTNGVQYKYRSTLAQNKNVFNQWSNAAQIASGTYTVVAGSEPVVGAVVTDSGLAAQAVVTNVDTTPNPANSIITVDYVVATPVIVGDTSFLIPLNEADPALNLIDPTVVGEYVVHESFPLGTLVAAVDLVDPSASALGYAVVTVDTAATVAGSLTANVTAQTDSVSISALPGAITGGVQSIFVPVGIAANLNVGDEIGHETLASPCTVVSVNTASGEVVVDQISPRIAKVGEAFAYVAEGQKYFVLDSLDGVKQADDVDVWNDLAVYPLQINVGTEVAALDAANNVVVFNQGIISEFSQGVVVDFCARYDIAQDALAGTSSLTLDSVASVIAGDKVRHINRDPAINLATAVPNAARGVAGTASQETAIVAGSVVASVDSASLTVTLDNILDGVVPVPTPTGTVASVDVYRGMWYAKYAGSLGNSLRVEVCGDAASYATWAYKNSFNAAPGTSDYALTRGGSNDEMHIVVIDEDGLFTGVPGTILEKFEFASQARDAKLSDGTSIYYARQINDTSEYIWFGAHHPDLVNAGQEATGTAFAQLSGVIASSLTLGADSGTPAVADYMNGWELFKDVETVDVDLVVQPAITTTDGLVLQQYLINDICEFRRDCMALLSPPTSLSVSSLSPTQDVIDWFDQVQSTSYASFDSCALKVYDKHNDQYLWIPASSSIAGLCARTDDTNDAWWSPAGYNRGQLKSVIKLANIPKQVDRDALYSSRINPLVTFAGEGTILYGDKTALTRPSAFDRINVRRLFIALEKTIANAAKYSLFEFNDEYTREQFKAQVEPFLRNVQSRRGITEFQVICDETNNTDQIINTNQFVGDIYVRPNRSINFVQLNFIAVRNGVSFTEVTQGQ